MLVGKEREELGHLEGRSNKMEQIFGVTSPTDNRARKEWTIKASSGSKLKLHIKSERAGSIHQDIELK